MDSLSSSVLGGLQGLDEASRKEMLQFIEQENSKSKVQMSIHKFTDLCFKKCNQNTPVTGQLTRDDEACLSNCVNRFLDTNIKVVATLQGKQ